MSLALAAAAAAAIQSYLALGLAFALLYLPRAAARMDPQLARSSAWVRVLLFPGMAVLWPLMAYRWALGRHAPPERNPHRTAAAAAVEARR